jgi:TetR/AcrR family transcriptional regulator, fatty acid metabolism regulator protein
MDKNNLNDTKAQLVDAAISIFYEKGFQKARVSDIVKKARVAQGTFYLYFRSKDDIFLHICTEFKTHFATLIQGADNLFLGHSHEELEHNLLEFIRELIRLYLENRKIARIIFYESGSYKTSDNGIAESIYSNFIDMIRVRLEQNKSFGHISFEDAGTEAVFLVSVFSRSLLYFIETQKDIDIDNISRRMTLFILGGLCKR